MPSMTPGEIEDRIHAIEDREKALAERENRLIGREQEQAILLLLLSRVSLGASARVEIEKAEHRFAMDDFRPREMLSRILRPTAADIDQKRNRPG
ncbi:hypothetical protein QN347_02835 [Sphingomonas sp. 10B4]|nr:hypothetical protein [Sphingomonas sp. 10B4]